MAIVSFQLYLIYNRAQMYGAHVRTLEEDVKPPQHSEQGCLYPCSAASDALQTLAMAESRRWRHPDGC